MSVDRVQPTAIRVGQTPVSASVGTEGGVVSAGVVNATVLLGAERFPFASIAATDQLNVVPGQRFGNVNVVFGGSTL